MLTVLRSKVLLATWAGGKENTWNNKFQSIKCSKTMHGIQPQKGKQSKTDIEKRLLKLMNNAVHSKTLEYVRKHAELDLVSTRNVSEFVENPTYKARRIINEIFEKKKIRRGVEQVNLHTLHVSIQL